MREDIKAGRHIELHPGTDRWMMGDRFGTIAYVDEKKQLVRVHLHKSGQTRSFKEEDILPPKDLADAAISLFGDMPAGVFHRES